MKLRRETEVAIAILVACARSNDCRLKTADAAKVAETTTDFAAHVVLKLVNAGFLKTKRGRNGGLELSRSANAISLCDVICRVDDQHPAASGRIKAKEEQVKYGPLSQIILGANNAIQTYLDLFSIADLAKIEGRSEAGEFREGSGKIRERRPAKRDLAVNSNF